MRDTTGRQEGDGLETRGKHNGQPGVEGTGGADTMVTLCHPYDAGITCLCDGNKAVLR